MILDHIGPLRFKGLTAMPAGLGPVLVDAYQREDNTAIQVISEAISKGAALDWFAAQSGRVKFLLDVCINEIKQMQQLLRHAGPGYGVERCLYMMNPFLPCLSPNLGGAYVATLDDLLPMLELVVARERDLKVVVDRHIAAFVASRIRRNIDRMLAALEGGGNDPIKTKLGMLTLYARLQAECGPESLPYLTEWFARELEPALKRFRGKSRRRTLKERLETVAASGSLVELNRVLNDDNMLRQDEGERRLAERRLNTSKRELAMIQSKEHLETARRSGWRVASGISGIVAMVSIVTVVMW